MTLMTSSRHTREDLRIWAERERMDGVYLERCGTPLDRRTQTATDELRSFATEGPCYLGVSWGKDSVVTASLAIEAGCDVPLVWVRVEPIANPDCDRVRDAFLHRYPSARYHEITVWCRRDPDGWHATGTLEEGFRRATLIAGADRYISGIRAEESTARELRINRHGASTSRSCAPIGRWTGIEVFAFLHHRRLPIHPAYACSFGGALERERIRVASIGGTRGTGKGRAEWEQRYYGDALRAIDRMIAPTTVDVAPDPQRVRRSWRTPR